MVVGRRVYQALDYQWQQKNPHSAVQDDLVDPRNPIDQAALKYYQVRYSDFLGPGNF